jgi:hypothetical protein
MRKTSYPCKKKNIIIIFVQNSKRESKRTTHKLTIISPKKEINITLMSFKKTTKKHIIIKAGRRLGKIWYRTIFYNAQFIFFVVLWYG